MTRRLLLLSDARYEDATLASALTLHARDLPSGSAALVLRERRPLLEPWLVEQLPLWGIGLIFKTDSPRLHSERTLGAHVGGNVEGLSAMRSALGSGVWVSAAAHTDDDVSRAAGAGATAVLVSPIFDTPGKGPARGLVAIERARALAGTMQVFALGGVDRPERAEQCRRAGADGVALVRAAWSDNGRLVDIYRALSD